MPTKKTISLSFAVSDNYSQHLAVCIASFVFNTPNCNFVCHVLHQNITEENQVKIGELQTMYSNCKIVFHKIEAKQFEGFTIPKELEHISIEAYFRYILPDVLADEDRTIYTDVDVLAVQNIETLWDSNLNGNYLGAILEHKENTTEFQQYKICLGMKADTKYFYSGLLVMDLKSIREKNLVPRLFENTKRFASLLAWPDQDIINLTFMDKITSLDDTWNCTDKYSFFRKDVKIWHFPGFIQKPWCNIWKNITWVPYLKYLRKSSYKENALKFVMGHILGFFYFTYTKKQIRRTLVCGILVNKKRLT